VVISLNREGDLATIRIQDNGTGIPEEIRPMMFQPNFTTKTSGMGLGLAIVMKIAETFGWQIRYETKMGTGTTFYIDIPVHTVG
jgi:signal transduction histidine kinase